MEMGEGLPDVLREMGYLDEEFEYVTGDDAGAQAKIDAFGSSSRWILTVIRECIDGHDQTTPTNRGREAT